MLFLSCFFISVHAVKSVIEILCSVLIFVDNEKKKGILLWGRDGFHI